MLLLVTLQTLASSVHLVNQLTGSYVSVTLARYGLYSSNLAVCCETHEANDYLLRVQFFWKSTNLSCKEYLAYPYSEYDKKNCRSNFFRWQSNAQTLWIQFFFQYSVNIYFFKVKDRNTMTMCEICLKLLEKRSKCWLGISTLWEWVIIVLCLN